MVISINNEANNVNKVTVFINFEDAYLIAILPLSELTHLKVFNLESTAAHLLVCTVNRQ